LLFDRGVDINAQGGQYGNALQAAACEGRQAVVKLLINRGVDVDAFSDSGFFSMPSSIPSMTKDAGTKYGLLHHETIQEMEEHTYDVAPVDSTPSLLNESIAGSNVRDSIFVLLLEVFRDDAVLGPLFKAAIRKMDREKAVTSLRDFLHGFCVLLRGENPTDIQSRIIQFLRHQARAFAEHIYGDDTPPDEAERVSRPEADKQTMIDNVQRLLNSISPGSIDFSDPNFADSSTKELELESQETDTDNTYLDDLPEDLLQVKMFIVEGKPMDYFRLSYKKFVDGEPLNEWNERVEAQVRTSRERHMKGLIQAPETPVLTKLNPDRHTEQQDGEGLEKSVRTNSLQSSQTIDKADDFVQEGLYQMDSIGDADSLSDDDVESVLLKCEDGFARVLPTIIGWIRRPFIAPKLIQGWVWNVIQSYAWSLMKLLVPSLIFCGVIPPPIKSGQVRFHWGCVSPDKSAFILLLTSPADLWKDFLP
jgi:hypothetical protein